MFDVGPVRRRHREGGCSYSFAPARRLVRRFIRRFISRFIRRSLWRRWKPLAKVEALAKEEGVFAKVGGFGPFGC